MTIPVFVRPSECRDETLVTRRFPGLHAQNLPAIRPSESAAVDTGRFGIDAPLVDEQFAGTAVRPADDDVRLGYKLPDRISVFVFDRNGINRYKTAIGPLGLEYLSADDDPRNQNS
jgi:hypothetical protein